MCGSSGPKRRGSVSGGGGGRRLLAGHPEAAAALGGTGRGLPGLVPLAGRRLLAGGRLFASGRRLLAPGRGGGLRLLGVRHLQLGQSVAQRTDLVAPPPLEERQQRRHPVDRHLDLLQVALALGPGHQAGAPPAQVDQRDRGLQQDVVDRDLLQLGLQRGPHLLLARLRSLLAHATTSWAYVSAVSWTAAANTSSRAAPASIIRRWRWAPLSSGSATSRPSS